jgi:site-specific DNA recombinase
MALIYTRVSSSEQANDGMSLSAQVADCRRYVAYHATAGWIAGDELQDVESGRRDSRPAYQQLLLMVRGLALTGTPAVVVVASLDRLGRNIKERVRAYEELTQDLRVSIHSVREGGVVGEFTYNVLAAVAQEESRKLGERVRATFQHVERKGWHKPGSPRWGYRWRPATDDERKDDAPLIVPEPHPVEAAYVREVWARAAAGDSLRSIAVWARGLPSDARGGRSLGYAAIRNVIQSPMYAARPGSFDAADPAAVLARPVGRWEPLIADDTWRQAHESLRLGRAMPRQASGEFPLTGLLWCSCGSRMSGRSKGPERRPGRSGGRRREYGCSNRQLGADVADISCFAVAPAPAVESAVLGTVGELLAATESPERRAEIRRIIAERERRQSKTGDAARLATLEQQREKTRQRLAMASIKFLDGDLDKEAYDVTREALSREMEAIGKEIERIEGTKQRARPAVEAPIDAVLAGVGGWARALQTAAPKPVREALGVLIQRIEPVRIGYGRYEARIEWTAIGRLLLEVGATIAPSENLVSVDQSAQARCSSRPTVSASNAVSGDRPGIALGAVATP